MPSVSFVSLGCAKNLVDTEVMIARLGAAGWQLEADARQADTVVINTCAFIDPAKAESTEFVLLDPGDLSPQVRAHPEAGLNDALDNLSAPYIEVHEEFGAELEHDADFHKPPIATVIINGNIEIGYRIGLSIALRQLNSLHRSGGPALVNHFNY